jgi:SAM-dependent methyltransferase
VSTSIQSENALAAANVDPSVVAGFGDEWTRMDQSQLTGSEYEHLFDSYFHIFPWDRLPPGAVGFDLGCGSGRWARGVAPRVGELHCADASGDALAVDALPFADASMDFGYCLGVLHHVPDTAAGLAAAVAKLKPGAPFLLYLYYAFDNQPLWYRSVWKMSEGARYLLSRSPHGVRYAATQVLAATVYYPLARAARLLELGGVNVHSAPLSAYRNCSFYTMRTDALDRFGTRLEQRFTRTQIQAMMEAVGLRDVAFSDRTPYWCAVGVKR